MEPNTAGIQEPDWARRYDARDYPAFGYTADVVGLTISKDGEGLEALIVRRGESGPFPGAMAFPGGFVDQENDLTARAAARRELQEETGITNLRFLETLNVYDRNGRDPRQFSYRIDASGNRQDAGARVVSTAFLGLFSRSYDRMAPRGGSDATYAGFEPVYRFLPWENLISEVERKEYHRLLAKLSRWAGENPVRAARIPDPFPRNLSDWNEELALERLELLEDAGLVEESSRDRWGRPRSAGPWVGDALAFDHRKMLAEGIARVRGKVKYLPEALAALFPAPFTLTELRLGLEAILGRPIARQNMKRVFLGVHELIRDTGGKKQGDTGAPASVYHWVPGIDAVRLHAAMRLPFAALE